ncbi:MAG: hypothetical protein ACRD3W_05890, partial [Terriglobales bacterium]
RDELIESIILPKPRPSTKLFVDKVSKRRDQDISTVCGAYHLSLEGGVVREARIAFGGLAATPMRAVHVEKALCSQKLTEATIAAAAIAMCDDFEPLSDLRGTAEYRLTVSKNLLKRLYVRLADAEVLIDCDDL